MEATKPASGNKKKLFPANISVGKRGVMSMDGIRDLAKNDPQTFFQRVEGLIAEEKFTWESVRDVKALFNALYDIPVPARIELMGMQRAITTSAFPLLTGALTVAQINAAYAAVPTIGEQLVTEITDSKKVTTVAAITSLDKSTDVVPENQPFPEISAGEEKVEIRSKRNGRRLTITAETIEENNVADIISRCNALGEISGEWIEEQTLDRVTDRYGSKTTGAGEPYVYRPNSAGAALYSATANTPGARAPLGNRVTGNALVDPDNLDIARARLASMQNSRGRKISIPPSECILLVPDTILSPALKILNSELVPGEVNAINAWGPRGSFRPRIVSSPKLDDISTSAWYYGNFKKQFLRKWKLNLEYVTLTGDLQKFLESRIAFQARVAWDVEIGATDYVFVIQSLESAVYI